MSQWSVSLRLNHSIHMFLHEFYKAHLRVNSRRPICSSFQPTSNSLCLAKPQLVFDVSSSFLQLNSLPEFLLYFWEGHVGGQPKRLGYLFGQFTHEVKKGLNRPNMRRKHLNPQEVPIQKGIRHQNVGARTHVSVGIFEGPGLGTPPKKKRKEAQVICPTACGAVFSARTTPQQNLVEPSWNPGGTLVKPDLRAPPRPPRSLLG